MVYRTRGHPNCQFLIVKQARLVVNMMLGTAEIYDCNNCG